MNHRHALVTFAASALALVCIPAFAARQTVGGIEWNYHVENGGAVVGMPVADHYGTWSWRAIPVSTRGAVSIPATLGGLPVRKIGDEAFEGCSGITSVSIPATVEEIGGDAFLKCSSLSSVAIPAATSRIEPNAFNWCDSLASFSVASGNATYRIRDGMLYRGSSVLVRCPPAKSGAVSVPSGTEKIEECAFAGCSRVTSVSLPEGLKTVEWDVFWNCSALASLSLPASLGVMEDTFSGCSSIASFSVAAGNAAFQAKGGVLFSKDGTKLLRYPPAKPGTSYAIPSGTAFVDSEAFCDASKLVSLSFPASVSATDEDENEFYLSGCSSLVSVNVDGGCPVFKSAGGVLFSTDGSRLVAFPPGKSGAYSIPAGTVSVDCCAFEGCEKVTSLSIPAGFTGYYGSVPVYGCSALSSFSVASGNGTFRAQGGVLFRGSTLVAFPPGKTGAYAVPSGTLAIGEEAFATARLTSVSVPSTVGTIGALAFYHCESLSSVSLSSGLSTIDGQAFEGCKNLKSLSLPASVSSVGVDAFVESGLSSVSASAALLSAPHSGVSGGFAVWTGLGSVSPSSPPGGGSGGGAATAATLVFDANGGSVGTASKTVAAGDKAGEIPLPVREGWRFEGWWTDPEDGGERFCAATAVPAGVTTLYARWSEPDDGDFQPVYRFYSKGYKGHFFTIGLDERNTIYCENPNWNYEGVAYYAATREVPGSVPLYRFYSKNYRGHFYTTDEEEMWTVRTTNPNWRYEGVAFYVMPWQAGGTSPVFRFWSKGYRHHFYTMDEEEKDTLVATNPNWNYERIAFYAWEEPPEEGDGPAPEAPSWISVSAQEDAGFVVEWEYTDGAEWWDICREDVDGGVTAFVTRYYDAPFANLYWDDSADIVSGRRYRYWIASGNAFGTSQFAVSSPVAAVGDSGGGSGGGDGSGGDDAREKVQLWEGGPYWATTNIGADAPEDCGYYVGWGDTVGYRREGDAWVASDGSSQNFSFGDSFTPPTFGKNIATLESEGWIANGVLAPECDAAQIHWGGAWRIPTYQELYDLCYNKCDWTWTMCNGVEGYEVRGRGNYRFESIFLPAAGVGNGTLLNDAGAAGFYWSSVPYSGYDSARDLYFYPASYFPSNSNRYDGRSIRPVQGFAE